MAKDVPLNYTYRRIYLKHGVKIRREFLGHVGDDYANNLATCVIQFNIAAEILLLNIYTYNIIHKCSTYECVRVHYREALTRREEYACVSALP